MNDLLCQAIRERRLIELHYHGHARVVAPHVYGIDSTGQAMLSGYQLWGGSQGGEAAGWKSFKEDAIASVKLTGKRFGPRPEYRHNDPAMTRIFCQI